MAGFRLDGALAGQTLQGGGLPFALILAAGAALALPPDPQRSFEAKTCEAAKARYHEAQAGSPLVSEAENAKVLAQAEAQVRKLCDVEVPASEKARNRLKDVRLSSAPKDCV